MKKYIITGSLIREDNGETDSSEMLIICHAFDTNNAELIVNAVNNFDRMLKVLKAISNYADSVNARSDFYGSPLVADVKAVIKEVEQK